MKRFLSKADFINKEFYIDSFNLDRIFEENTFTSYQVRTIPVGNIIMPYPGTYIKLEKSPVYAYLNGDIKSKEAYELYCKKYGRLNPNRTVRNYNKLIDEFKHSAYDVKKGIIVVNQANVLLDGQHRACLILNFYGKKHKIPVLVVQDTRCTFKTRIMIAKDLIMHKAIIEI